MGYIKGSGSNRYMYDNPNNRWCKKCGQLTNILSKEVRTIKRKCGVKTYIHECGSLMQTKPVNISKSPYRYNIIKEIDSRPRVMI